MRIGVMGACGVVGMAVTKVMAQAHEVLGYDPSMIWTECEDAGDQKCFGYSMYRTDGSGGLCAILGKIRGEEEFLSSDLVFICAPTPWDEENNCFDEGPVKECLKFLDDHGYQGVIVLKSTITPVAISGLLKCMFCARHLSRIVACPEFLNARSAYEDFKNSKHCVIGATNRESRDLVLEAHKRAIPGIQGYLLNSPEEAMMVKYMTNCFFAAKNAVFNEFASVCREKGYDYQAIRTCVVQDDRIGEVHTDVPGYDGRPGYGGACLPKDVKSFVSDMMPHRGETVLGMVDKYNEYLRSS